MLLEGLFCSIQASALAESVTVVAVQNGVGVAVGGRVAVGVFVGSGVLVGVGTAEKTMISSGGCGGIVLFSRL